MNPETEWRKIEGWEHYLISNNGQVRSLPRYVAFGNNGGIRLTEERILNPGLSQYGYRRVRLCENRVQRHCFVHQLVLIAFDSLRPTKKHECNHKDGIKTNNHISNLEWVTRSQNQKHKYQIGLDSNQGENGPSSKLTNEEVLEIRRLHITGEFRRRELATIFNVTAVNISNIINLKSWSHLKGEKSEINHSYKLRDTEVLEIRRLYATGEFLQRELAAMFNITRSQISKITLKNSRTHI